MSQRQSYTDPYDLMNKMNVRFGNREGIKTRVSVSGKEQNSLICYVYLEKHGEVIRGVFHADSRIYDTQNKLKGIGIANGKAELSKKHGREFIKVREGNWHQIVNALEDAIKNW